MEKEAKSKSMNLSDDITPRVTPYYNESVRIHGMYIDYLRSLLFFIRDEYI